LLKALPGLRAEALLHKLHDLLHDFGGEIKHLASLRY
jgi:hypothetical protein